VESDARERGRRDQADLQLVARQHRADGAARRDRHHGEQEVDRGDAESGGDADARAGDDRRLDEQQAHGTNLHRDCEPNGQACDQRGRRVHELR
jgi:hypothetical protein